MLRLLHLLGKYILIHIKYMSTYNTAYYIMINIDTDVNILRIFA